MTRIFKGFKMLAVKDQYGQWWEIEQDCVQCGACCKKAGDAWPFSDGKGGCKYLEYRAPLHYCMLMAYRPFGCSGNDPHATPKCCSVKLRKVDNVNHLL